MQGRESQLPSNFYLSCGNGRKGQTPGAVTLEVPHLILPHSLLMAVMSQWHAL